MIFPSRTSHALDVTLWTFLVELHTLFGGGLGGVLAIRKEKWPSQNESRFALNDPAIHVASNNFAMFSPKMMSCLVDLLKKYHDFQWRFHPLKQIVWLHRKITKKHIFPHQITRWNRFNQWHGRVHCPKWTSTLLPLEFSRKNQTIIADVLISSRPSVSRVPSLVDR